MDRPGGTGRLEPAGRQDAAPPQAGERRGVGRGLAVCILALVPVLLAGVTGLVARRDRAAVVAGLAAGVLGSGLPRRRSPAEPEVSGEPPGAGAGEGAAAAGGTAEPLPLSARALLHDLAAPLTLALAEARRLAGGELGPLVPHQAEAARRLAARLERVARMVRAELDRHSNRDGSPQPGTAQAADRSAGGTRELTSLAALLGIAVEQAEPFAAERGVLLVVEPIGDDPLAGYWDPDSVSRVLANLLDNSIKYTPAGGKVEVAVRSEGRDVRVTVRDTGLGLLPEELEAVLEAGRRGSAAARTGAPGLGLGLATCRVIAAAHGGRLWIESEGPGCGAAAHVRLPLDRRRGPRGPGRWPARVDWGGGREMDATVEAISRSGAAVRVPVEPPVGALVALRIDGLPGGPAGAEAAPAGETPPAGDAGSAGEVAALGRIVRIIDAGHPQAERRTGGPDPRPPLAAVAFTEMSRGAGARLELAAAAGAGRPAAG